MENFNDLKTPLAWGLGILFIVTICMMNANTVRETTNVGGDAWNATPNMSSWNFNNHSAAGNDSFIANIVRHLNSTPFNFGTPSSADIMFFENQESVDIESLIEEVIAEMDAADDSTATAPNEE